MRHPRRRNVTTSVAGLENGHICKSLTQNGEGRGSVTPPLSQETGSVILPLTQETEGLSFPLYLRRRRVCHSPVYLRRQRVCPFPSTSGDKGSVIPSLSQRQGLSFPLYLRRQRVCPFPSTSVDKRVCPFPSISVDKRVCPFPSTSVDRGSVLSPVPQETEGLSCPLYLRRQRVCSLSCTPGDRGSVLSPLSQETDQLHVSDRLDGHVFRCPVWKAGDPKSVPRLSSHH